jgi:hypothetical protein
MHLTFKSTIFNITNTNKIALSNAHHVLIQCLDGKAWLTINGITEDFVLTVGEQFLIQGNGLALLQGLPLTTVQLSQSNSTTAKQSLGFFDGVYTFFKHHIVA